MAVKISKYEYLGFTEIGGQIFVQLDSLYPATHGGENQVVITRYITLQDAEQIEKGLRESIEAAYATLDKQREMQAEKPFKKIHEAIDRYQEKYAGSSAMERQS